MIHIGKKIKVTTINLSDGVVMNKLSSTKLIIILTSVKDIVKYDVVLIKNNLNKYLEDTDMVILSIFMEKNISIDHSKVTLLSR